MWFATWDVKTAKFLMKVQEVVPKPPSQEMSGLHGVFHHESFVNASEEERKAVMLRSAEVKYREEIEYPWDHYFGADLRPLLEGKTVLDLGCYNGGRGAAWYEHYGLTRLVGVDVGQTLIDAAEHMASVKGMNAEFFVGKGETLPLEDESFDAVLSYDVFEHVSDVRKTLDECWRVLRPGGQLFVVFPGYYHPTGHHLSQVTKLPFFHY